MDDGRAAVAAVTEAAGTDLAPFQRRFLAKTFRPGVDMSVLSVGRGNGKSWLTAGLGAAALTPGSALWRPGTEVVMLAGSVSQARIPFRMVRRFLGLEGDAWQRHGDYDVWENQAGLKVHHKATGTELRVISSDSRRAFGLGANQTLLIGDEPGSWQERAGALMFDAISTAGGKLAGMRVILIGTRAPGTPGGWWRDLVDTPADGPDRHVQVHAAALDDETGEPADWRRWRTVRRANPAIDVSPALAPKLRSELARARRRERDRLRFQRYRLNCPVQAPRSVLLTAAQWAAMTARDVAPRDGRPVAGVDVGSNRAWTAGALVWPSGRVECMAVAPGRPSLHQQEERDGVEDGAYTLLERAGVLRVDPGVEVVRPRALIDWALSHGPEVVIGDSYRIAAVRDAVGGRCPVRMRSARWADSTADIGDTRAAAVDGNLSIDPASAALLAQGLSVSIVEDDDHGSARLAKVGREHGVGQNRDRDDVVLAWVLAAAHHHRRGGPVRVEMNIL